MADRTRLNDLNLYLVETDGEFFVEVLKAHAWAKKCICDDEMYVDAGNLLARVNQAHSWLFGNFNVFETPQILIAAWYQDGMQHALERIIRLRKTGEYSDLHKTIGTAQSYFYFAKRFRQDGKFGDAAYCEGYANAAMYASLDQSRRGKISPPLFFHFGGRATSSTKVYARYVRKLPSVHKAAHKHVVKAISKLSPERGLVVHHFPQLSLGKYLEER